MKLLPMLLLLALMTAIALAFPYEAVSFQARRVAGTGNRPCVCAIVELDEAGERTALQAARSAWQKGGASVRQMRVDMSVGQLPEDRMSAMMPDRPTVRRLSSPPGVYGALPMPPTVAAGKPTIIPRDAPEPKAPAFSRRELLAVP